MLKKTQKAWALLGAGLIVLMPAASYATETEFTQDKVTHIQRVNVEEIQIPTKLEEEVFEDFYDPVPTPEVIEEVIEEEIVVVEEIPVEVPASSVSEMFVAAALAQVGIPQDCTDLVQNSLAAIGLTNRRDAGGFDFGVQQLAQFGYVVSPTEAQPGDIAIIGPDNGGHVWIILDPYTGEGIHGGWNGMTQVGNNGVPISAHLIIRLP